MKICFIVHDYNRHAGHSRYVAELATRFNKEHEVHVFANTFEENPDSGIHFHKVPALRFNVVTTLFSFALSCSLARLRGFDIVHTQGFCGPRADVITAHICNRAWSRALRASLVRQTARERVFHFLASRCERWLYRGNRRSEVIAISQRVARDLGACYGCRMPVHLVYHGVDLQTFSPEVRRFRTHLRSALQIPDADTAFLYVGDLRKGARTCLEALARITEGHLILVSRSSPGPYAKLAAQLGITRRVHFVPPTSNVEQYYGTADALLLPSPYDAFGMVVTEAMACGLPVVVSREAGASELICHAHNGLVLNDFNDAGTLADCMLEIHKRPAWAKSLGERARAAVERLSWDEIAHQTMAVYRRNLAQRDLSVSRASLKVSGTSF